MLQLVPEFLMIIAGIMLFIYTLAPITALVLLYVILAGSLFLYVLAFSIVSTTMGSNMIVNESKMHLIAYWMYVAFSFGCLFKEYQISINKQGSGQPKALSLVHS
ncbi:uncharacterized protein LOC115768257 isoform X3 [Drosophila novamexicana]|nr:uncharacterized protein LOC115768257 isoform X3 [Drosophila novamexicana]